MSLPCINAHSTSAPSAMKYISAACKTVLRLWKLRIPKSQRLTNSYVRNAGFKIWATGKRFARSTAWSISTGSVWGAARWPSSFAMVEKLRSALLATMMLWTEWMKFIITVQAATAAHLEYQNIRKLVLIPILVSPWAAVYADQKMLLRFKLTTKRVPASISKYGMIWLSDLAKSTATTSTVKWNTTINGDMKLQSKREEEKGENS